MMKIHACDQLSPEWFAIRRGIPTASEFGNILTAKTLKYAASAHRYICRLIGEKFDQNYGLDAVRQTQAMRDGQTREPEARLWYECFRQVDVKQVGFCTTDDDRFGCSPDGLIGEDGGLELKCPTAEIHTSWLLEGEQVPDEHKAQVHGCLIVTGRKWWDFVSYVPGLKPLIVRTEPNTYTKALREALEEFYVKFRTALRQVAADPDAI